MKDHCVFKTIFAEQWPNMPPVLQQRYANRAHSQDEVVVDGTLDVHVSLWVKCLSPFLRLCGALLPYAGKNIPVQVRFSSDLSSDAIGFNRCFHYPNRKPYHFHSRLVPNGGDSVIEFMKFGLGWRMRYVYEDGKAQLRHDGYIWRIGKFDIPLPLVYVLGRGYADEQAISDNEFVMYFDIKHPLFGKVFGYKGHFKLTQSPHA